MKPLRIEILAFDGCPNADIAREHVVKALEAEGLVAEITQVDVPTVEVAQKMRFLGSPSVRVNGGDVEANADHRRPYGLMCRTYHTAGQIEGAPSIEAIRAAMRKANTGNR